MLTDKEFKFYFIDTVIGQFQYGKRTSFCSKLHSYKTTAQQINFIRDLLFLDPDQSYYYSVKGLQDDSYDPSKPQSSR